MNSVGNTVEQERDELEHFSELSTQRGRKPHCDGGCRQSYQAKEPGLMAFRSISASHSSL